MEAPKRHATRTNSYDRALETKQGLVIFDGDDTLWETMPLYSEAKDAFFLQMATWGFDRALVQSRFDRIDAENVKGLGFTRHRFPDSMARTYKVFCAERGLSPLPEREVIVREIGTRVFQKTSPLLPGVKDALKTLCRRFSLVLFTKGDLEVQHARILNSGLGEYFAEVCIAPDKTATMLLILATRHGQVPSRTWVVGNSLRSDVKPALEAGMRAIWIPYETWIHEEADEEVAREAIRCEAFVDLPAVIAADENRGL